MTDIEKMDVYLRQYFKMGDYVEFIQHKTQVGAHLSPDDVEFMKHYHEMIQWQNQAIEAQKRAMAYFTQPRQSTKTP